MHICEVILIQWAKLKPGHRRGKNKVFRQCVKGVVCFFYKNVMYSLLDKMQRKFTKRDQIKPLLRANNRRNSLFLQPRIVERFWLASDNSTLPHRCFPCLWNACHRREIWYLWNNQDMPETYSVVVSNCSKLLQTSSQSSDRHFSEKLQDTLRKGPISNKK